MNFSLTLYWPILLAVFSDIFYQICAKSTPANLNPFASLTVTYLVGAAVSALIFFLTSGGANLLAEWKNINWTTFVLGLAIVGLEAGSIYMYKAGWAVNTGYIVKALILAIALIAVGYFLYKEQFSMTKAAGIAVCLAGLYLINR
ncbi:MAG: DMT family transporter [Firmicutes bacterium]|nr:DMT family transporter [Bacillota bacterium]